MTEDLPEDRQKTVEAGLALFQQVQAERDALRTQLREANEQIARQQVEIESIHQLHNMLESHMKSYVIQRDEAVAHRAAYETLFATIQAQLRVFDFPAIPLIKEASHEAIADEPVDLDANNGSGHRPSLSNPSAGSSEISRRAPVLAHAESLLGQRTSSGPRKEGTSAPPRAKN